MRLSGDMFFYSTPWKLNSYCREFPTEVKLKCSLAVGSKCTYFHPRLSEGLCVHLFQMSLTKTFIARTE